MLNIKKGDVLKYKHRDSKGEVLGIFDGIYAIESGQGQTVDWYTEKGMENLFILPKEEWEPSRNERYYSITELGEIVSDEWTNHRADQSRRAFLGVYRTYVEAQQALVEIKRKLELNEN